MQIIYSPTFRRLYRKLERDIQQRAEVREHIFRQNPFDARLETHKLHGRLSDLWAFFVTRKIRITFEFGENQMVTFHEIGDHDIYS
ncbi:MAG TPA: type II toxin-antitoxin system mRNA interferase toxin, RelE/StbE family [Candidatus Taylorbacteria bacterium]|nr:MAG: hypothetical protein UY03_C0012G0021 [Parcubacteria group bacterium GW2011_GWA2_47_64]KKU96911.1 MAG: hypothetical protein UY29_C0005G0044 [Parcubacteria group bacterium GW2011_GWC2_48_17]HBV01507.1 type II toxin-antitoxin system mRNA interferase toxin, RelE/StbE family [Candidatus Taylorbacteria bacterium]